MDRDSLALVVEQGGPLESVAVTCFDSDADRLTSLHLRFANATLVLSVAAASDEIAINSDDHLARELGTPRLATHSPWSEFSGCELKWAWQLVNQQGYSDGVRLVFGNAEGPDLAVELIASASAMRVFVCEPVQSNSDTDASYVALQKHIAWELGARIAVGDDPSTPAGCLALSELIADAVLDIASVRLRDSPRRR